MRKLIVISLIGSAAMGLLAACGDSGDAEPIDKATFVKRANAVCERISGKIAAEFTSITQKASQEPDYDFVGTQILVVKRALIPRLEEQLQQIRALGVPEDARRQTEALHAAYDRSIRKIKANPRAAATQAIPPYESIELAGTAFGVTECPVSPISVN